MSPSLLAFDTSTETLSVALAWDADAGARLLERTMEGGREASSALVPAVMGLLSQAGLRLRALQAIVFGAGPGSFTGLRTACAVAQGLAFGADRPVLPIETLMAVAEQAHGLSGATRIVAMLDARMGEVYWAAYVREGGAWLREGPIGLSAPESATGQRIPCLPTASALLRLAPALLAAGHGVPAAQALPLYVRDKVAQTTEERAALRQARDAAVPGAAR